MKKVFGILMAIGLCLVSLDAQVSKLQPKLKSLAARIKIEQERFPAGDLSNAEYAQQLINQMYSFDQEIRQAYVQDLDNHEVRLLINEMDEFHTTKMKQILLHHGWITISKFGSDSDHKAWLLVQHADHDPFFQAGCLLVMSRLIDKDETNRKNYAFLYDRVSLNLRSLGMKQKYGTQVSIEDNEVNLLPHEGTAQELDQRRHEMGLPPLEEYLKTIKLAYQK